MFLGLLRSFYAEPGVTVFLHAVWVTCNCFNQLVKYGLLRFYFTIGSGILRGVHFKHL